MLTFSEKNVFSFKWGSTYSVLKSGWRGFDSTYLINISEQRPTRYYVINYATNDKSDLKIECECLMVGRKQSYYMTKIFIKYVDFLPIENQFKKPSVLKTT